MMNTSLRSWPTGLALLLLTASCGSDDEATRDVPAGDLGTDVVAPGDATGANDVSSPADAIDVSTAADGVDVQDEEACEAGLHRTTGGCVPWTFGVVYAQGTTDSQLSTRNGHVGALWRIGGSDMKGILGPDGWASWGGAADGPKTRAIAMGEDGLLWSTISIIAPVPGGYAWYLESGAPGLDGDSHELSHGIRAAVPAILAAGEPAVAILTQAGELQLREGSDGSPVTLTADAGIAAQLTLAAGAAGALVIVRSETDGSALHVTRRDGAEWQSWVTTPAQPIEYGWFALAMDGAGTVHLAAPSAAGLLYLSQSGLSEPTTEIVAPAGAGRPSIAVAPDGTVFMSHLTEGGALRLYHGTAGTWTAETVVPDGAQNHTSLAVDDGGLLHLLFDYTHAGGARELRHGTVQAR